MPTDAQIEAAAKAIIDARYPGISWVLLAEAARDRYRKQAHAALEAAEALEEVEWEYVLDNGTYRRFTSDPEAVRMWQDRGYTARRRKKPSPAGPWIALEGEKP